MTAIALPTIKFLPSRPRLDRAISAPRFGNRLLGAVEWADPVWNIDLTSAPLRAPQQLLIEAFREELRGGMATVLFVPVHNCLPRAYWGKASAAAVLDNGALVSVTNGRTVAINGVTNGLALARGDLFSLATGDYRSLHRVMADAVAASGAITLSVEPAVPAYITAGAVARWKNPELNMRLVPGSFQLSNETLSVASFSLTEVPK